MTKTKKLKDVAQRCLVLTLFSMLAIFSLPVYTHTPKKKDEQHKSSCIVAEVEVAIVILMTSLRVLHKIYCAKET